MFLDLTNATMTAYALAFLHFRYKNLVFILILAALMVPAQVTVLPNYLFLGRTMPDLGLPNWVNTYQGIIGSRLRSPPRGWRASTLQW